MRTLADFWLCHSRILFVQSLVFFYCSITCFFIVQSLVFLLFKIFFYDEQLNRCVFYIKWVIFVNTYFFFSGHKRMVLYSRYFSYSLSTIFYNQMFLLISCRRIFSLSTVLCTEHVDAVNCFYTNRLVDTSRAPCVARGGFNMFFTGGSLHVTTQYSRAINKIEYYSYDCSVAEI